MQRALTLPAFPVERRGRVAFRNLAGITPLVDDARRAPNVAEQPLANDRCRGHELAAHRALLRTDLEDFAVFLLRRANQHVLFKRKGQRFFTEDVLARLHRFDRHLRVPVVGRADRDGVDVVSVKDAAIIVVRVWRRYCLRLFTDVRL